MRKIIPLLLALLLCLSLCSCANKDSSTDDSPATIINSDGKTEELTAKQLIELFESNEAKFDQMYEYCSITVESEIKKIEGDSFYLNGTNYASYIVHLDGGWDVEILQGFYDNQYSHLDVGDTVKVTSKIHNCLTVSKIVQLCDIHTDGMGNKVDETKIKVVD